jgi:RNA polymerase sigma factor (sigma-70 family)
VPSSDPRTHKGARRFGEPTVTWADSRLIRACLNGNEQAWAALIAKYKNLIYSIPLKYGASPQDAADIFQSVCVELFSELPRLRQSAALRGWITTVTVHKASRWKQRNLRRAEQELTEVDEDRLETPDLIAPEIMEQAQREQMVRNAVTSLSPRCREIIRLLFYEQPPLPYKDLAERLGLATGSIGFIRGRCLASLQRALEKAGF